MLYLLICSIAFGFRMQPSYYDQRIDGEGGYAEINYKNTGNDALRYKFILYPGEKNDMSKWIELYPKVLTIPPKSIGKLKIFAKAPTGVKEGEYNFSLYAKPIVIPTIKKGEKENKISVNATTIISMNIGLSGYVGDPKLKENIKFEKFNFYNNGKGISLNGEVKNNSFRGVSIGLRILNKNKVIKSEVELGRAPSNNVLKVKNFELDDIKKIDEIETIILYDMISRKDIISIDVKK